MNLPPAKLLPFENLAAEHLDISALETWLWDAACAIRGATDAPKFKDFIYGSPSWSSADWGWAQHILASLNDNGRATIVLDTGAVSRGSGSKSSNQDHPQRVCRTRLD